MNDDANELNEDSRVTLRGDVSELCEMCKQAEGQPHTPTQCDRHIVLSLTHHAMLQGGLETLRVADDLWTKREERGTNH